MMSTGTTKAAITTVAITTVATTIDRASEPVIPARSLI
jgi:hypothetical protein